MHVKQLLMSAVEIRTEIQSYLEQVKDESFLKVVHSMLETYVHEQAKEIIGYRTDTQEPVYKNELAAELDAAVAEVDAGDFITLEELEAEMSVAKEEFKKAVEGLRPEEKEKLLARVRLSESALLPQPCSLSSNGFLNI